MRVGFSTCEAELRMTNLFMTKTPETPPVQDMVAVETVSPEAALAFTSRADIIEEAARIVRDYAIRAGIDFGDVPAVQSSAISANNLEVAEPTLSTRQTYVDQTLLANDARNQIKEAHNDLGLGAVDRPFSDGLEGALADPDVVYGIDLNDQGPSQIAPPLDPTMSVSEQLFKQYGIASPLDDNPPVQARVEEKPFWKEQNEAGMEIPVDERPVIDRVREDMRREDLRESIKMESPEAISLGQNIPANEAASAQDRAAKARADLREAYGLAA